MLPVLGVVLGLLGLASGVAAWFRAAPKSEPAYSAEQIAVAKGAVCEAFERAVKTLEIAGRRTADDRVEAGVVAVNTRLALASVNSYLNSVLQANPATPADLVGSTRDLADSYQEIELAQLADATKEEVATTAEATDATAAKIKKQCA